MSARRVAVRVAACVVASALAVGEGCSGEASVDTPSTSTSPPTTTVTPTPPTPPATATVPPSPTPPIPAPAPRLETRGEYRVDVARDCDGFPYVALTVSDGRCAGLVVHRGMEGLATSGGPFRPRTLVEDPAHANVLWVVDAGGHRERGGRLYRIDTTTEPPTIVRVVDRLDRPHGSAIGPDGWLYVGEVQRIVRFDPSASDVAASREVVIDGLPTQIPGRDRIRFHPLSAFVFTAEWDLVLNRGSSTDHCAESLVADPEPQPRCHDELEGTAGVVRYTHVVDAAGNHGWSSPRVIARGLRNSVALVAHPSGTILQGENGVDFPEDDRPAEELNVLAPLADGRAHFGWPYCLDRDRADERWSRAGFSCDVASNPTYAPPHLLLPAHGAPLGMTYYEGSLEAWRDDLLVVLHGYRARGHRVLAFDVDASGLPSADATPREIVTGWDASDTGPRGAPVSVTVARDGSVWIVEDNNGTVLRLARDAYASSRAGSQGSASPSEHADERFTALHRDVLVPRCAHCHETVRGDADHALTAMRREGWLRQEEGEPHVWQRVRPGATRRMPMDATLRDDETASIRAWLDTLPR
jgi:glucose/arabinose dehydrogenase